MKMLHPESQLFQLQLPNLLCILDIVHIFLKIFFRYREKMYDGQIVQSFIVIYCFNRFWIEFFAISHLGNMLDPRFYGLNLAQWLCLFGFLIAGIFLIDGYLWLKKNNCKSFNNIILK